MNLKIFLGPVSTLNIKNLKIFLNPVSTLTIKNFENFSSARGNPIYNHTGPVQTTVWH